MVNITKLYPSQDAAAFYSFGRVFSGTCEYFKYMCTYCVYNHL